MKKLNKKGVTLIELIVSFAIVSIAMIYFYQTIVDLHRMYKNSNKATDEFVNKDYALRVLDAYIKKNGVTNLGTSSVCSNYLLGYCNTASVTKDGVFSKVELKKGTDVLATSYYYTEDKIVAAIESTALDNDGNVKSIDELRKAVEKQVSGTEKDNYSYEQGIEDGKVKYEVKYTESSKTTTIYTKEDNKTIDTKLKEKLNGEPITEINANNFLAAINSNWIVSNANVYHDEKENKYYATYDVIKEDNKESVAKNVIKISELEKLDEFNLNVSGDQSNREYKNIIGKQMKINGATQHIENKDSYYLTFELSSNSTSDYCALFFSTDGTTSAGKEYNFEWNSEKIESIYIDNVKDIGINYEKKSDGSYVASFIRFNATNQDAYIKPYAWNSTDCKAKLVKAYKYK